MTPGDAKRDIRYIGQPEPGEAVTPSQFGAYVQDKMEFEGLIVNVGLRYDRLWGQDVQLLPSFTSGWYNAMDTFIQAPTGPMRTIQGLEPQAGYLTPHHGQVQHAFLLRPIHDDPLLPAAVREPLGDGIRA